jgi:DNA-binding MarR family transcriptional regulator
MNVTLDLTDDQIQTILDTAASDSSLGRSFMALDELERLRLTVAPHMRNPTLSNGTLRALLVLAALPADGSERALADIARDVDLSPSTSHRYLATWVAAGVVKQNPDSRRYRRSSSPERQASKANAG